MISIKEYAQSKGVSYEAVRRQVKRFKAEDKEFKNHIQESKQRGVSTLLDDYAVEVLDKHRLPRPVIVRASEDETQRELENLRSKLASVMTELDSSKTTIIKLQEEKIALIEDKTKATTQLEIREKDLSEYKAEIQKLNQELGSYKKTFFGLYKKAII